MEKIFHTGEKIFFITLIICIVSSVYFTIVPLNYITLSIGFIFLVGYFEVNFYIGITNDLNIREAIVVGLIGCGMGLFLLFFALYTDLILGNSQSALWLITPYFMPTMSLVRIFFEDITIAYPIVLMIINISLVLLGSITKKIMNKFKV